MELMLADISQMLQNAWPAGVMTLGLGTAFAIVLLIASIKLKVERDPKVEQIQEALPNIDCGACGYAGCASYAKAVAANPELLGKCSPGGAQAAARIAQILNLQVSGEGAPLRPVVYCRSHTADREYYAAYTGIPTCTAANAVPNVQACKFGCLGYGDCVVACQFDALHVVDGLATVDYEKCTGCGACVKACPRYLIEMVPFTHDSMMVVGCNSQESGKDTRAMCKVGCIGCKMCTKQAPEIFEMKGNLARVVYDKYEPCEQTEAAMEKCPTKVIVYRGKTAPAPVETAAAGNSTE